MKHRLWVLFLAVVATFCMTFGLVGCNEKTENTGNDPSITDPSGDDVQGGEQGGTHNPDEGDQEPETYTEGLNFTELYGEDGTTVIGYIVGVGSAVNETEIVIPDTYHSLPVLAISMDSDELRERTKEFEDKDYEKYVLDVQKYTFGVCKKLRKITLGKFIKKIGVYAFDGCDNLMEVELSQNLTEIGYQAFCRCKKIKTIVIPGSVASIDSQAFLGCDGLEEFIVDESNETYSSQDGVLYDKAQTQIMLVPVAIKSHVSIPDRVTSIGSSAFYKCSKLTSITIGSGVTEIGERAFEYCSGLTEIKVDPENQIFQDEGNCLIETKSKTLILGCSTSKIPNDGSVTSIGERAFEYCSGLISITIPDNVTSIGKNAFYNCSGLTSVIIGSGVTEIGDWAFYGCDGLTSITIPNSVTSIGSNAFSGCSGLKEVHFENPNGWKVSRSLYDDAKTVFGLDNPEIAALYLTDVYSRYYGEYYWKREG